MMTAFVTAMASNTYSYLPLFKNELAIEHGYITSLVVIAVSVTLALIAYALNRFYPDLSSKASQPSVSLSYLYVLSQELIFGVLFGLAMCVSNMTLLSAVISFLDLPYWNPALGFVMGGAIAVALPSMYLVLNRNNANPQSANSSDDVRPFLDAKFHLPKLSAVDRSLVIGAAIFGIGWGIFGACPGPALVNIGSGNIPPIVYAFSVLMGMYIEYFSTLIYEQWFHALDVPDGQVSNMKDNLMAQEHYSVV